jgi:hypothetical protein
VAELLQLPADGSEAVVGLITAIRSSFGRLHDRNGPALPAECLGYLNRAKVGASIAVAAWLAVLPW